MKPTKRQNKNRVKVTCRVTNDEKMVTILDEQNNASCDPIALEKSYLESKKK